MRKYFKDVSIVKMFLEVEGERRELTTWIGSREKNGEGKLNVSTEGCENINALDINKY